jgi:hypothetical protein
MIKFNDIIQPQARTPSAKSNIIKGRFKIQKSEDDNILAFGWANVAVTAGGEQIEDYHEDLIDPEELEQAAYKFVELYREG